MVQEKEKKMMFQSAPLTDVRGDRSFRPLCHFDTSFNPLPSLM